MFSNYWKIAFRNLLRTKGFSFLNISGIAVLLSKDFVKLVLVSLLVAAPVAWWAMNKWLQGYSYRVRISPLVFIIAGLGSVGIALLTMGWQALKAAMANPVKNLRTE
jgi:putative ABC transport system permease protein